MISQKREILTQRFGFHSFREGQEEVMDALLTGRDALAVMPTGSGKSLCFQIPALLFGGLSLVISPLISLMKDQVSALRAAGISAAFLNSALAPSQMFRVLESACRGEYSLLYVAPERLDTEAFQRLAAAVPIPFVAVDEAHCVSQWGQDFRPSYLRIESFLRSLPSRPVLGAFTATATPRVREDMAHLLGLEKPRIVTTGFDRSNLYFEVRSPEDKFQALAAFLRDRPRKSGIIYCLTRKTVDTLCEKLCSRDYQAVSYHAGLTREERQANQERFQRDDARIMVATNAFGMGIDKSNVQYVLHYNMPKDMESYYQEAGRAGRDGLPAECVLLHDFQDLRINTFLIEKGRENEELDPEDLERLEKAQKKRLRRMVEYCHSSDCLRREILSYFGENPPASCGNCGNCLRRVDREDVTIDAQKILSCVKRMKERYGLTLLMQTLRGSRSKKVLELQFDKLSTYGIMRHESEKTLRRKIDFLLGRGYMELTEDAYPVLQITPSGGDVLFRGARVYMPRAKEEALSVVGQTEGPLSVPPDAEEEILFEKLRDLRKVLAKEEGVPAFVIFSDATLRDLCTKRPRNAEELLHVEGIGYSKRAKYGDAFLEALREHAKAG